MSTHLSAQQNKSISTDVLIQKLYGLWDAHYKPYNIDHISGAINDASKLFETKDTSTSQQSRNFDSEIKKAESDLYKKDWGLGWNTNFLLNSAPGMEMADNIIYRSRVQTEVRWDILRSGYFQNKTLAQIKQNESFVSQIEQLDGTKKMQLFEMWHSIIYHFNLYKITIVNLRLELSKSRVETAYQLYENGMITQEEMLKNVESYAEVKSLLNIYKDYNDQLKSTLQFNQEFFSLPLIDINYEYTVNQLKASKSDTVIALLIKNIELEQRKINDINVGVFSRYNYYDIPTATANRSFFTFGVNVGVPLVFDKKEQANYRQIKTEQIKYDMPEENIQMEKDVLTYFYEYRYKLKQFNSFYYKSLLLKELLRKEQARHEIDPLSFNPLKALRTLDELMSVDIELIDLKQQMYLYLLRMYVAIPSVSVENMMVPLTLDSLEIKNTVKTADEVYVWSKTLTEHSPNFLAEYCTKQKYKKLIVSIGGQSELLKSAIAFFSKSKLSIDLMIGNNDLIKGNVESYLVNKVTPLLSSSIAGLHLDVEPHTFPDWDTNKEYYLNEYVNMVKIAKIYCIQNKLTLSISIPLHYPKESIEQLFELVDFVYFMCYENVKTDYIVRKTEGYDATKTIIALRTEDFGSISDLNNKIDELANLVVVKGFVIHDLGRLIQLDN
jgi:hypothetical protein